MSEESTLPIVYLAIGSNVEPEKNLQEAVDALKERCNVLAISSVYQSTPYGFKDQADFLDICVKVSTPLLVAAFKLSTIDKIERQQGRDRSNQLTKDGPLPLDIDILLWSDEIFHYGSKPWRVPHPSIVKYSSVAIPLAEIAPDMVHPEEGVTLQEIAERFKDHTDTRKIDLKIE
ncbi:MAG: 2-amino-4-hydroxy-6-hydroxymethyldihydropteridine diphosphokinase [Anaerolineae bacterium]